MYSDNFKAWFGSKILTKMKISTNSSYGMIIEKNHIVDLLLVRVFYVEIVTFRPVECGTTIYKIKCQPRMNSFKSL